MVEQVSCEICGRASAVLHAYGPFGSLCAACLHDLEVRNDLDRIVVKLVALARRDPEAALKGWSEFYENNKRRTRGDWLRLAVACHRVDVLLFQQRWADAEHELRELIDQVEKGTELHRTILKSMASALDGLGRTGEAIDVLCKLVLDSPDLSAEEVLSTLHICARIAKINAMDVPAEMRDIFVTAATEYGIAGISGVESSSLIAAIESVHQQRLEAQDRYVKFLEELRANDPSTRREHLKQYAQREPVRFFRDMALRYAGEDDPQG